LESITGGDVKKILILGAAGFLGSHLEHRLKRDGHFVVSAARHPPKYRDSVADEFHTVDLRNERDTHALMVRHKFDETYQLAGNVGGLGHIGVGTNDAEIMSDSIRINLSVLEAARKAKPGKILFASSQCVYPDSVDVDPFANERIVSELDLLPRAHSESDASFNTFAFGQEKLFAEKLYDAYNRNHGLDVRIARIGNTYGPYSTWDGERAKAPAAICRKIAQAPYAGVVDLWGDPQATRSFTYVDDAVDGMIRLMATNYWKPVNIGSHETVTIQELFEAVCQVAGKILGFRQIDGPMGVRHRGSDNSLCKHILGWEPPTPLYQGLKQTYPWIKSQVDGS
jgi:GDP-D-mannose 3', 5'-epimerase